MYSFCCTASNCIQSDSVCPSLIDIDGSVISFDACCYVLSWLRYQMVVEKNRPFRLMDLETLHQKLRGLYTRLWEDDFPLTILTDIDPDSIANFTSYDDSNGCPLPNLVPDAFVSSICRINIG